jgi:hypothetical protein
MTFAAITAALNAEGAPTPRGARRVVAINNPNGNAALSRR